MKTCLLISFAIISIAFTAFSKKQFTPPGTVQINDSLFCDKTEISNFSWKEFVW